MRTHTKRVRVSLCALDLTIILALSGCLTGNGSFGPIPGGPVQNPGSTAPNSTGTPSPTPSPSSRPAVACQYGTAAIADQFAYDVGGDTQAMGSTIDPHGNIYVVGYGYAGVGNSAKEHWLVRQSSDFGKTWSTVDDYDPSTNAEADGAGLDSNGNVLVVGSGGSSGRDLIVRMSADQGKTWSTLLDYVYPGSGFNYAQSLVADSKGNLYVAGGAMSNAQQNDANALGSVNLVLKSADDGKTWSLSDSVVTSGFANADPFEAWGNHGIAVDPSGDVFSIGSYGGGSSGTPAFYSLIIRKSADQGASWATVENLPAFARDSGPGGIGRTIISDAQGNLYATGLQIFLKSTDHGATWSTQNFQAEKYDPWGIIFDQKGNLLLAGSVITEGAMPAPPEGRLSSDDGKTWGTVHLAAPPKTNLYLSHLQMDSKANIYWIGQSGDPSSDMTQWLVDEQMCN